MQNNDLAAAMKLGMRRLASGVCVLSTRLPNGERFAMTVSSVTSVSDSPASLLVCINQQVSQQDYLARVGSRFVVNVLSVAHQDISNLCAGRDPTRDRFSLGNWQDVDGLPVLADALASFMCETDQVSRYGTHHIVIARITAVTTIGADVNPLIYIDAGYGALARR